MASLDTAIALGSLVGVVAFGVWLAPDQRKVEDYYLDGRRLYAWAPGICLAANQVSAVSLTGVVRITSPMNPLPSASALLPYSSIWAPSSTICPTGRPNAVAGPTALRAISAKSFSRHSGIPGRSVARSVSRPRK